MIDTCSHDFSQSRILNLALPPAPTILSPFPALAGLHEDKGQRPEEVSQLSLSRDFYREIFGLFEVVLGSL